MIHAVQGGLDLTEEEMGRAAVQASECVGKEILADPGDQPPKQSVDGNEVLADLPSVISLEPVSTVVMSKRAKHGPEARIAPLEENPITQALNTHISRPGEPIFLPAVGMEFNSFKDAKDFYNLYSWEIGFGIRKGRNCCNYNNYMTRQDLVCSCEGLSPNSVAASFRTGCKAMIKLHRSSDHGWVISRVVTEHNHQLSSTYAENKQWPSHSEINPMMKETVAQSRLVAARGHWRPAEDATLELAAATSNDALFSPMVADPYPGYYCVGGAYGDDSVYYSHLPATPVPIESDSNGILCDMDTAATAAAGYGGGAGANNASADLRESSSSRQSCRKWRPAEDAKLRELVTLYGPQDWKLIAEKLNGRSGMSCRQRWFNYLDPDNKRAIIARLFPCRTDIAVRCHWHVSDEERLMAAHRFYGNKWDIIAHLFPSRTNVAVRKHWKVIMACECKYRKLNQAVQRKLEAYAAAVPMPPPAAEGDVVGHHDLLAAAAHAHDTASSYSFAADPYSDSNGTLCDMEGTISSSPPWEQEDLLMGGGGNGGGQAMATYYSHQQQGQGQEEGASRDYRQYAPQQQMAPAATDGRDGEQCVGCKGAGKEGHKQQTMLLRYRGVCRLRGLSSRQGDKYKAIMRTVYIGLYDTKDEAARAYDLAALKYWGPNTPINFPVEDYRDEIEKMKCMEREEYVAYLRRKSIGFSRGSSIYRGVRRHRNGAWYCGIQGPAGRQLHLGAFSNEEEAAEMYDIAAIKYRGLKAVTNFDKTRYEVDKIMESSTLLPVEEARKVFVQPKKRTILDPSDPAMLRERAEAEEQTVAATVST